MISLKHRKIIFLLIAILFVLCIAANNVFAGTMKEIKKIEATEQKAPQEAIDRPRAEYRAADFKDPFRAYTKEGSSQQEAVRLPELVIRGVVWGGEIPQAIINDTVVKAGDTIENVHIVDINKNGIDVFFEGRQFNLKTPAFSQMEQFKQKKEGENDEK